MKTPLSLAVLLLAALVMLPSVRAQVLTLKITGQTLDDQGQPVSGVTVRLTHMAGDVMATTTTDAGGNYSLDGPDVADWVVSVVQWPGGYTPTGPQQVTVSLTANNPAAVVDFRATAPPPPTTPSPATTPPPATPPTTTPPPATPPTTTPPPATPPTTTPPAATPPPPQTADDSAPLWPYVLVALALLAGGAYLFLRSRRRPATQAAAPVNFIEEFLKRRDAKAWDAMFDMWDHMPASMQQMPMMRQQLAFAMNRSGRDEEAEAALRSLLDEHGASPETNGILGRVYKDRWLKARKAGQTQRAADLLDLALETYLGGHKATPTHPYPGLNALTLMEFYDPPPPRRHTLLAEVSAATKAMPQENPYWDHATRLELAVLADDEAAARAALADAVAAKRVAWELETTRYNLRLIRTAREERGVAVPAWVGAVEDALTNAMGEA